jgi:hypothetical protein
MNSENKKPVLGIVAKISAVITCCNNTFEDTNNQKKNYVEKDENDTKTKITKDNIISADADIEIENTVNEEM